MRGALVAIVLMLVVSPAAAATTPRTTLPDVEDEVMCVVCGTPLNESTSPVADRERAFIRRDIARGRTKQQIKDDLVGQFGSRVLAEPRDSGFGLAAYLVPALVAALALAAVAAIVRRWRRRGPPAPEAPAPLAPADERRLERELAGFDG